MRNVKKAANRITPGKRRKIRKLFYNPEDGVKRSINRIAEDENVTYFQAYRAISGELKLDDTPRSDKGQRRGEKGKEPRFRMEDFEDVDDFLFFTLMDALEQSATENMIALDKVKLVKDIEVIQNKIQQRQLINKMRRPDAEVIAIVIRKYEPAADYKRIVEIYKSAQEEYIRIKNTPLLNKERGRG